MHNKEIKIFTQALKLAKDEFYLDSVIEFQIIVEEFPESELVDDCYFNIGLCYFNIYQFQRAKKSFEFVISHYPDAIISILDGGNEYGRTSAKCYLGIVNCYLGMDDLENAKSILNKLEEYSDSYIILPDGKKELFYSIGKKAVEGYINFKQRN